MASSAPQHPEKPSGISKAVVEGVAENNEAFTGDGNIAMPAPSAQPAKVKPVERPAKIDVQWTEDEDEDAEWRRAGGGKPDQRN